MAKDKAQKSGWYLDPRDPLGHRWWDGTDWTDQTPRPVAIDGDQLHRIEDHLRSIRGSVGILAGLAVVGVVLGIISALGAAT